MLNWWYGLHSKAHVPPRRWKLNDCTSNAFYFDFNQHVQKLLDKETTKCLFQKWFPIFIIALTLAGVRPSRRHFSMRCQKRIRASYMRLSEEQVHENVPHTTHSNWFVYNIHFSYTLPIYIYTYIYIYYWFHHWYLQKCMWTTTACQDHLSAAARLYWRYAWCIDHGICQIT